jgi:Zn-dependent peptidase ImmA (M78 family)
MQHGFKTRAEKIACEFRTKLGLAIHSPLPAKKLLDHLGVLVFQPVEIPGLRKEVVHEMQNGSSQHWSAVTIHDFQGHPFVIHNPDHAPTRQESDLMHEAAHIICKHPPGKIVKLGELNFRSYDEECEEQAKWLGGCLQITRRGLLWAIGRSMTQEQMCEHFCASEAIVRYRRNMTGVDVQMTRFNKSSHW